MKKVFLSVFFVLLGISLMAQAPVTLKLNLEKGKVYTAKSTSKQTVKIDAAGQQFNIDVFSNNVVTYKVLKQENDIMDIELKFDTIASKSNSPMGSKEINSAKPNMSDPMERIMNKISTSTIIAKISTAGKFVDFVNYPKFKDHVLFVLDSIPAGKRDQAKMVADALVQESAVRTRIEPLFAYLPEKAVKTGDSWESTYSLSANNATLLSLNTFTLKGVASNVATVSGKSEIESLPSNDPAAQMTQNLKGTMTSDGTVDVATGLMLKNTAKGHIEGTMTVKANNSEMKMQLESESETIMIK
jgi:hypothetical protein